MSRPRATPGDMCALIPYSSSQEKVLLEAPQTDESAVAGGSTRCNVVAPAPIAAESGSGQRLAWPGPGTLLGEQCFPDDFDQAHGTGSGVGAEQPPCGEPDKDQCVGAHHRESSPG
jgi:hypothetical protein